MCERVVGPATGIPPSTTALIASGSSSNQVDEDCKDIPNVDGTHWETAEGWCITWIDWVTVTRRTSTVMLHIFGIYDTQQSFSNQRTIWCEGSGGGWS